LYFDNDFLLVYISDGTNNQMQKRFIVHNMRYCTVVFATWLSLHCHYDKNIRRRSKFYLSNLEIKTVSRESGIMGEDVTPPPPPSHLPSTTEIVFFNF
jgi:hypothetical protein